MPRREAKPPPPPRRRNHWGQLLGELGLQELKTEPDETEQAAAAEIVTAEAVTVEAEQTVEVFTPFTSLAESDPKQQPDTLGFQPEEETDPLAMSSENVIDAVAAVVLEEDDAPGQSDDHQLEEDRPRRRRRRGRRRPVLDEVQAAPAAPLTPEEVTDSEHAVSEFIGASEVDVAPSEVEEATAHDEAPLRRRRRRRRRGGRGDNLEARSERETDEDSDVEGAEVVEEAGDAGVEEDADVPRRRRRRRRGRSDRSEQADGAAASAPEAVDDEGMVNVSADENGGADEGSAEEQGLEPMPVHHKIPTWAEAIDVIVQTNSVTRARSRPPRGRRRP